MPKEWHAKRGPIHPDHGFINRHRGVDILPGMKVLRAINFQDQKNRSVPDAFHENRPVIQCQLCSYVPKHTNALDMGLCKSKAACRKRQQEGRSIDRMFDAET